MWAPQPKYWLWMMSGAVMRSISLRLLVCSQVGMTPSVSPLCGSVSIAGIGMKGAVAGSSQCARPEGGGAAGAVAGTGAGSCARAAYAAASSASTQAAAQVVAEHGDFAGLRAARESDPGVGAPAGAFVIEFVDDIELDLTGTVRLGGTLGPNCGAVYNPTH